MGINWEGIGKGFYLLEICGIMNEILVDTRRKYRRKKGSIDEISMKNENLNFYQNFNRNG